MPDEVSVEDFMAMAGKHPVISPERQASRDSESVRMLRGEKKSPDHQDPEEQASLGRQIERTKATSDLPKEMDPASFMKMAGAKPNMAPTAASVPAPEAKPAPKSKAGYWDQVLGGMKRDAKSAADLGDMVLSIPGGVAAVGGALGKQLYDQVHEAMKGPDGKGHKAIGQDALELSNELSDRFSTNIFARMLNGVVGEGKEVQPSDVQKAMTKLGEYLAKGGEIVEKATGGKLTSEEVQLEAQLFMNLSGAKGLVKMGGKLVSAGKAKPAAAEAKPTPEPPIKPDPNKPKVDFKTFQQFTKEQREAEAKAAKTKPAAAEGAKEETPAPTPAAKQKVDFKAYQKHLKETAEAKVDEAHTTREGVVKAAAEATEKPADPEVAKVYEKTQEMKKTAHSLAEKERGALTPEQAWNLAALSLGLTVGAYMDPDNPLVGAYHGVMVAALGTAPALRAGKAVAKAGWQTLRHTGQAPADEVRATPLVRARNAEIAAGGLQTYRDQVKLHTLVPNLADRQVITHAIDQGKTSALSGPMAQAAGLIRQRMVEIGNAAMKAGVLKGMIDNYISHVVAPKDVAKAQALFNSKLVGGASTSSRFAQARTVPTIAALKAAGIEVVTEDPAEILAIYGRSMQHAVANKNFANRLQMTQIPGSKYLMAYPEGKAPPGYVDAGIPRVRVHPDLEASVKFIFEAKGVNGIAAAGLAFNTAIKRLEVVNPLFHYRSLLEARMGSTLNWPKALKEGAQFMSPRVFGENEIIKQLKFGPAGDRVEKLLKQGLQVTFENSAEPLDSDIRGNFYKGMTTLQRALDEHLFKGAGTPVRAMMAINHKVDNMLWGRGQAGWKVATALEESEKVLRNAGKRGKFVTEEAADKIAVQMSNMRYGSLDWHMLAEETKNKFLRNLALNMFEERGRAAAGVLFFAPDWKASTLGAFIAQFGKGSGPMGLWKPTTLADLARQQMIRTGIYYLTIVNGINYALSGHFIWENGKDGKGPSWMWIDRGDGTKMSGSKHALEPFHAMENPGTFAISSLGVIPSEILDQATNRDYNYVGPDKKTGKLGLQGPPMEGSRLDHALKRLAPIGVPDFSQGAGPAAWSALGYNVYGKTEEQKRELRKQKRQKEFEERQQKLRESIQRDQERMSKQGRGQQ